MKTIPKTLHKRLIQYILFVVIITLSLNSYAQRVKKIPPRQPKLVIGIVVDQMRYDYLYRYWDKLDKTGFKRLVSEGTFCKNANFNYLFTQTAVGHATIFTGATPAIHGIISNQWHVRLRDKGIYCVGDNCVKTLGSKTTKGEKSPKNLLTTTIGDELRLFNNKKSKVIGISLKDRAAILSAGHMANAAYWFDDISGNWITSSFYMNEIPAWVSEFNEKKLADFYLDREWVTLLAIDQYTESIADKNKFEKGFGKYDTFFPYDLNKLSQSRRGKRNYNILKSTPFGNTLTKDFAIQAIINEELGQDEYPDLLTVSFSATDYIGHQYGPASVEMEDAFLRLDREISHFLDYIDKNLGKENVLLFLTADHGGAHIPEYLENENIPAGRFKHNYSIALLKSYLKAIYGEGEWVDAYKSQQIYLNRNLIEDAKLSLKEVQTKAAQFLVQFSGVANAITASTLEETNFTSGIFEKMQNSFSQKRSGDVLINLEPGWIEDVSAATNHNSGYNYDTHVPLFWYGWKIKKSTVTRKVNMVSVAPTISTLLNISTPNGCMSDPIWEITE